MRREKGGKYAARLARWAARIAGTATIAACVIAPASLANAAAGGSAAVAGQAGAPAAAHPVVGVQDSWPATCSGHPKTHSVPAVNSPYWAGLHASTVRWSPTWDIAYQGLSGPDAAAVAVEQACFIRWLGDIRESAPQVSVEVAFKPDSCYQNQIKGRCPKSRQGQVVIPALSVYQAAMREFMALIVPYPQVRIIAPWGEPDFQPKKAKKFEIGGVPGTNFGGASCRGTVTVANCGPMLAAQMWVTVRELCPSCTVVAGDFGSNKAQDSRYFATYVKYLRDGKKAYRPTVWAIHPYTDVTTWEWEIAHRAKLTPPGKTLVAQFASWLAKAGYHGGTQIWLDEVSSFTRPPYGHSTYSRKVQAQAAGLLLTSLPRAGGGGQPRVTRIYYMRFAGAANNGSGHDALVVSGKREPAYFTVAKILTSWGQVRPPAVAATAASPSPSAPGSAPAATRYEIRSAAGNLCLDANDKGATAGQNGDPVQLWACYGGANQEWVPEYQSGQLARLASAKYPGMCLNADNTGGLANGRRVQLWNCDNAANELWNFAALTANPLRSPLFLGSGAGSKPLALDADKYRLGNGDKVQVWAYYGGASQEWYPDPA